MFFNSEVQGCDPNDRRIAFHCLLA
uniref:Uncharacterized protein n=1 Tax=Rhizophora mucronata TaxID=61149 RepID=A0A2P2PBM6_RHIMU